MSPIASPLKKSSSSEENFTFHSISINTKSDSISTGFMDWFIENDFVQLEGHLAQAKEGIHEVYFSLSGNAAAFYPLMRGIIFSGQPSSLVLQANHSSRNFTLRFQQDGEAREYLSKVFGILYREIRFKQVLRKVIANEEKFKLEERLLFNELSR